MPQIWTSNPIVPFKDSMKQETLQNGILSLSFHLRNAGIYLVLKWEQRRGKDAVFPDSVFYQKATFQID